MEIYSFYKGLANEIAGVQRNSDNACIPISSSNRDFVQFLSDWKDGATVTNADGTLAAYSEAAIASLGISPVTL